jgi:hypothetical protein
MSTLPNATCEQRKRLLERLRVGTVSTLEARRDLDIMHPAARVMELRNAGYQIDRLTVEEPSDCGRMHKVARYLLVVSGDGSTAPLPFPRARCHTRRSQ